MKTWIEKHRPTKFLEIFGQEEAIKKVVIFINNFPSKKRAMVLHGPPGTGKTTLAHVTAKETNAEIFELNASDLRNKLKLQEILKPALEQRSLKNLSKIILIDEVDGISAVDRGGLTELLSLIENSHYPVIITANDIWNKKLSPLRKKTEIVPLRNIDEMIITDVLFDILRKENLFLNPNLIRSIASRTKGDLRAAINDLQSVSRMKDPSVLSLDERNKETDIFGALKHVFQNVPTNETLKIFDTVKMPIDEIILWVEHNIPSEYRNEELARAYDLLSKTDVFKGRIYKQQYWRFLLYENILLSYGIASAKKNSRTRFTSYQRPTRILKIWMNNQRTMKKKSIAKKYAEYVHVGEKRAMHEFPVIKQIINSNPAIGDELRLTEEEFEYLGK